jgi:GNAT superfamily N-acetyltransferase
MRAMLVLEATASDFAIFMSLAAEVEDWFGPMVNESGFGNAVTRNIARRSALVVVDDSEQGLGGLLFSRHRAPNYEIGWLVVTAARRSEGIGEALVAEAVWRWVQTPAVVGVVAFGADHPGARSRGFYERLGFEPAEIVEPGPEGGSRQRFELRLERLPAWAH